MADARSPDPERIILATLERVAAEPGSFDASFAAKAILADLTGHRIALVHQPAAAQKCPKHPGIAPPCPLCRS